MVMDTLKKDHEEMHQRLVSLQNEKDKVIVFVCVLGHCVYLLCISVYIYHHFLCSYPVNIEKKRN